MIEFDWQIFWMWMDRMEKHTEEEIRLLKEIKKLLEERK